MTTVALCTSGMSDTRPVGRMLPTATGIIGKLSKMEKLVGKNKFQIPQK